MKKSIRIIAAAAILASFAACSQKIDYVTFPYARFESQGYTVNEDAGIVTIPVYTKAGTSGTVNFEIVNGTAKQGIDFTVEPANGSLNISNGSGAITLNIISHIGELTGDLTFGINITSVSEGMTMGGIYSTSIKIKDIDHPLTNLFGTYDFSAVTLVSGGYSYVTYDLSISPYEGDLAKVWIDFITPWQSPAFYGKYCPNSEEIPGVYAEVSDGATTITIPTPQTLAALVTGAFSGVPEEHYVLYTYNDEEDTFNGKDDTIVFHLQDDGSYITYDNYGLSIPSEYEEGLFYYYMNVWGDFNPNYPARFVKK